VLVDSSSLIYRAFFAVPDTVRAPDGMPVNAAYGFLNMLARLVTDLSPAKLACAWDDDWRPQWRVDLVPEYKAHRVAMGEADNDVTIDAQMDVIAKILDLAGIAMLGAEGYEAEDVIGSLASRARGPVAIVSGDRDLFQLVRDPDRWVLYPKRGVSELARIDEAAIAERYNIPGRAYADFATLRGDPSDGLPGVPGIGEKTAAALVTKYGTLEHILAAAAEASSGPLAKVAAAADYLERAKDVVRITGAAPVADPNIALPLRPPSPELNAFAERYALAGAVERLMNAIGARRVVRRAPIR
jgi:5'-3' exonuclease